MDEVGSVAVQKGTAVRQTSRRARIAPVAATATGLARSRDLVRADREIAKALPFGRASLARRMLR
jgi:hypothetical protein